jgi:hypothetical protein
MSQPSRTVVTMTRDPSLFDPIAADERQQTGIAAAVRHSGPTWQEYAIEYIRVYLTHHRELFCDDVWRSGLVAPASPRAFGQVMKHALHHHWMGPSEKARRSTQSNNALRQVYTSRIYADGHSTAVYPSAPPDNSVDKPQSV